MSTKAEGNAELIAALQNPLFVEAELDGVHAWILATDNTLTMKHAADRLKSLSRPEVSAELATVREALEPFARAAQAYGNKPGDETPLSSNRGTAWLEGRLITFGDLHRAVAALPALDRIQAAIGPAPDGDTMVFSGQKASADKIITWAGSDRVAWNAGILILDGFAMIGPGDAVTRQPNGDFYITKAPAPDGRRETAQQGWPKEWPRGRNVAEAARRVADMDNAEIALFAKHDPDIFRDVAKAAAAPPAPQPHADWLTEARSIVGMASEADPAHPEHQSAPWWWDHAAQQARRVIALVEATGSKEKGNG